MNYPTFKIRRKADGRFFQKVTDKVVDGTYVRNHFVWNKCGRVYTMLRAARESFKLTFRNMNSDDYEIVRFVQVEAQAASMTECLKGGCFPSSGAA